MEQGFQCSITSAQGCSTAGAWGVGLAANCGRISAPTECERGWRSMSARVQLVSPHARAGLQLQCVVAVIRTVLARLGLCCGVGCWTRPADLRMKLFARPGRWWASQELPVAQVVPVSSAYCCAGQGMMHPVCACQSRVCAARQRVLPVTAGACEVGPAYASNTHAGVLDLPTERVKPCVLRCLQSLR